MNSSRNIRLVAYLTIFALSARMNLEEPKTEGDHAATATSTDWSLAIGWSQSE